jgi:hypothetical protein
MRDAMQELNAISRSQYVVRASIAVFSFFLSGTMLLLSGSACAYKPEIDTLLPLIPAPVGISSMYGNFVQVVDSLYMPAPILVAFGVAFFGTFLPTLVSINYIHLSFSISFFSPRTTH